MDIEKVDFPESIEILAKKNGIELDYEKGPTQYSKNLSSEIFSIHDLTNKIYQKNISRNLAIKEYLIKRGLKENIISEFQIGYSDKYLDQVLKLLQKEGFSSKAMKQSGLFIETKKGYIDRFRQRIMFPIHNHTGNVAGFGGRATSPDEKAKYMNSPETPIYIKSKLLYGLWKTKQEIINQKNIIIVEGYMDFLKLYQSGIRNVVAVSGTAFTDQHAIQIKRICNNVFLLYDGDNAGKKAAIRAGYLSLKFGLETKIVEIPDGIDPDDWISQSNIEDIKNKIYNGINVINFHFNNESDLVKTDAGKTKFINDCLIALRDIQDPIYKELQIKKISELTNISQDSIFSRFRNISKRKSSSYKKPEQIEKPIDVENKNIKLENDLIKLCFSKDHEPRLLIFNEFKSKWLKDYKNKRIFDAVFIHLNSKHEVDSGFVIDSLSDKECKNHLSTLLFETDNSNLNIKMAKECINRLENNFIKLEIEELRSKLNNISNESDKLNDILIEISNLESKMNENI
jgi:DNA primase